MPAAAQTLPRLSLRSVDLTPTRAFQIWQATLPQYRMTLVDMPVEDFWIDVSAWLLEPLVFTCGRTSRVRLERPFDKVGDGYSNLIFVFFQIGRYEGEADGRPFSFGDGEICLFDASRPYGGIAGDSQYILVNVSRDALRKVLPDIPDLHGYVLQRASGRILAAHFEALARYLPHMDRAEAQRMSQATLTLMAASLGEVSEPPAAIDHRTSSAIRLRVERYIERNLASPNLVPNTISQALEIPRSTLYRAFTSVGGISSFIQGRRLDAARALLFHPEEHRSVGELADVLGFQNQASFSKAFHRRFGCSPRDARKSGSTRIASSRALFDSWRTVLFDGSLKTVGGRDGEGDT